MWRFDPPPSPASRERESQSSQRPFLRPFPPVYGGGKRGGESGVTPLFQHFPALQKPPTYARIKSHLWIAIKKWVLPTFCLICRGNVGNGEYGYGQERFHFSL